MFIFCTPYRDLIFHSQKLGSNKESLHCNKQKLGKRDDVPCTRVISAVIDVNKIIRITVKSYLIKSSKKTTLEQHPKNTKQTANQA